jgi:hypothetical protein
MIGPFLCEGETEAVAHNRIAIATCRTNAFPALHGFGLPGMIGAMNVISHDIDPRDGGPG